MAARIRPATTSVGRWPGPLLEHHAQIDVIAEHWDDLVRIGGSLKLGYVSAALLIAKLQGRRHPPAVGPSRRADPAGGRAGGATAGARLPARDPRRPLRHDTLVSPSADGPAVVVVGPRRAALRAAMAEDFPPRPAPASWPATRLTQDEAIQLLTSAPFVVESPDAQRRRTIGVELFFEWLAAIPGQTWQQRWHHVEADVAGMSWRRVRTAWVAGRAQPVSWHQDFVAVAQRTAISAEVLRPSLAWLVSGPLSNGSLVRTLGATRDAEGFTRLAEYCDADPAVSAKPGATRCTGPP